MDDPPLVSCIMPTNDRQQFIDQAVSYFLRQDYPNKQLVVVDDGERAIGDMLPADDRIKYLRLERRMPLGAKRNVACEVATGEIIAHLDDDDWMASDRVRLQVEALFRSEAELCGLSPLRYFRLETGEAYVYRHPGTGPWVAPGTFVYRRSSWATRRFPEIEAGESEAFASMFEPSQIHALDAPDLYVALLHPGNLSAVDPLASGWRRCPIDEVGRLIQPDREFYVRLRNGSTHTSAYTPRASPSVTVVGAFIVFEGYGSMTELAVLGMKRDGALVNVVPQAVVSAGLTPEMLEIIAASRPRPDAPVLYYSWPQADLARFRNARDLFIYTMFESSRVPASWVPDLNRARCVIVPTRYMVQAFQDSGVTAPVEFVHQGVDPAIYHYEDRPEGRGLTTLIVAPLADRKHTAEGIAAWKQAFEGDADARLILKSRFQHGNYELDDPRIRLVDGDETTRGVAHWYREADVLMALGNEGFGLPLVEGMATGLPVIALDAEGQSDNCADAKGLLLPVPAESYRPHIEAQWGDCGLRAYPSVEAVVKHLRWVATHRDEARAMGRAASEWALTHRNVWDHGPAILDVMEKHLSTRRHLRRRPYLWVSTLGQACGVAEYTRYLSDELPEVQVTAESPEPGLARVVHLQHEDSLHDDGRLAAEVARLHQEGARLVVTEHTVTPWMRPWERDVDVLVALKASGADLLKKRWPRKRIEYIPCGCPEYFPPRKPDLGKVIGTFGFAAGYKGFDTLLELQRAVRGSQLLIYSHDHGNPAGRMSADQIDGRAVRLISGFMPADEIAGRLAAEADVLVFWYKPVGYLGASAAVRIGLSTGVPVMTSPTAWFDDLKDVTYQPDDPVEGVRRLLEDTELRQRLVSAARDYCHENRWARIAQRHRSLWESLEIA